MSLEDYFKPFRENIVGRDQTFSSPFGEQKIIYADWVASGRIYKGIEEKLNRDIFPFVANTHTETSTTGATMSLAFHEAAHILLHSDEKKSIFLDDVDFDSGEKKEKEANVWAANLLIPKEHRIELLSLRAEGEILEFSKKVNVHPGIVVGRLQHERQIKYSSPLNRLKESLEV